MKFLAKWRIEGLRTTAIEAGEKIEAELSDVADMVAKKFGGNVHAEASAVLVPESPAATPDNSPAPASPETVPGGDVNLSGLTKVQLVAHAAEHHDLTLDVMKTKADLITAVEAARAKSSEEAPVDAG